MKTLRCHLLLIGLLWLIGPLAWGQASSARPGKSAKAVASKPARRSINDSTVRGFAKGKIQPQTPPHRLGTYHTSLQMPRRSQSTTPILIFFSAALGAVLFITLFTIGQYLLNRDAPFGWYAFYLVTTAIWLWQSTPVGFNNTQQPSDPPVFFVYMKLLVYGMIVSYIRFLSYLLEVPQQHPLLDRWTRYFGRFVAVSALVILAELYIWQSIYAYRVINVLNYASLAVLMISILRLRHPLRRYALAGLALLLSGGITAVLLNALGPKTPEQLGQMPLFYVVVNLLLEILCFSLALGRRFQLNKEEKFQMQEQLINQLEKNGRLQQDHTVDLERQLAQRTTEVLTKAHELEDQRISQLQSDFIRRIAEAEMTGLRSQMNPHFIFNCLNSIKLYATENDSEKASNYLTKFSKLIRLVLENSRSERVTLHNELETLRLYIELEAMRFKHKLSFRIDVDAGIDGQFMEIPPLLIQPYVENAIWHGLMHKPEGGTVWVHVKQVDDSLLHITITDDGVGRARAADLKSKSASHRKSFGLKMTSERIALVNQLYQTNTQVTIEDLVDADGQPAGTEVVIQIPI